MRRENLASVTASVLRKAVRHRLNSHAAEIAFFALLSLVPATITLGGALHLMAHIGGPQFAIKAEDGSDEAIRFLIGHKLADPVIVPFVNTQLSQPRGAAISALLIAAWLTSRVFHALEHALDVTFDVTDRRPSRIQRLISMVCAVAAVAVVVATLAVMAVGWHSGRAGLDQFFARTPVIAQLWALGRWPLLVVILLGILVLLYRYGPNVDHTLRHCLPGAVVAVALWIGAAVGFRAYLMVGAGAPTGVRTNDERVQLIGQATGAAIATGVWIYVSALVVLLGAEINAELRRRRLSAEEVGPDAFTEVRAVIARARRFV